MIDIRWNLPVAGFPIPATTYQDIVAAPCATHHPLNMPEIGVFRVGLLGSPVPGFDIQIKFRAGVDPFLRDRSDP